MASTVLQIGAPGSPPKRLSDTLTVLTSLLRRFRFLPEDSPDFPARACPIFLAGDALDSGIVRILNFTMHQRAAYDTIPHKNPGNSLREVCRDSPAQAVTAAHPVLRRIARKRKYARCPPPDAGRAAGFKTQDRAVGWCGVRGNAAVVGVKV